MVVDIPKDVQFARGVYSPPHNVHHKTYHPQLDGDVTLIREAVAMMAAAKRPVFYTGGGVINSGPVAAATLRELVALTGFPITSTLMGLGASPASGADCSACSGCTAPSRPITRCTMRSDDRRRLALQRRIAGRLDAFSPGSKKIHIDIDRSSINKNVKVDLAIVGDCGHVLEAMVRVWRSEAMHAEKQPLDAWRAQIDHWRAGKSSRTELQDHHQAAIRGAAAL